MATVNQAEHVFRMLNRPLWVVTAGDGSRQGGLIATWVTQASLAPDRPVICAGLAPNHFTTELVLASRSFAVHLLRKDQSAVAFPFCLASGRDVDKIKECRSQGIEFQQGTRPAPRLADCLAAMECDVYAHLHTGDRIYFWADVVATHLHESATNHTGSQDLAEPLCEHDFFQSATDVQLSRLRDDMEADIRQQRPWHETWRDNLPAICQLPERES